jgi:lysozyme family protein
MDYPPFFLTCFNRLVGIEAGFTKNKNDPGNWTGGRVGVGVLKGTKYGLSAATYPNLDIEHVELAEAQQIYYLEWWLKFGADYLDKAMVFQMWQFAINAGKGMSRRGLQHAVKVAEDGLIGEHTIAAIHETDLCDMLLRFNAFVLRHYASLNAFGPRTNDYFGRGWVNRTADALEFAAEDN